MNDNEKTASTGAMKYEIMVEAANKWMDAVRAEGKRPAIMLLITDGDRNTTLTAGAVVPLINAIAVQLEDEGDVFPSLINAAKDINDIESLGEDDK